MARHAFHARHRFGLAMLALGVSTIGMTAAYGQAVQVGIAAAIFGDVRIAVAAAPKKERAVARRQPVAWGDVVSTKKQSQLQILLLDRSNFTIGANARMTIDRFVYDPGQGRSLFARVLEGAFRFMSGARNANSSATIQAPVGTIGIRGTALDGVVGENAVAIAEAEAAVGKVRSDKEGATLVVLRGPGAATEGGLTVGNADVTAAGQTVTLDQPELAAYIPRPGAPPIGPFRISPAGLSQLQDLLQPAVVQAGKGNSLGKILAGAAILGAGAAILSDHDDKPPSDGQRTQGSTIPSGQPQSSPNNPRPRPSPSPTPGKP
jgi:hypothetical protein